MGSDRVNIVKGLKIVGINIGGDRSGNRAKNRELRGKDHRPDGGKSLEKLSSEKESAVKVGKDKIET